MTTSNLFAPFTEYHVDLSAADSTLNIPLKDLILTYQRAAHQHRAEEHRRARFGRPAQNDHLRRQHDRDTDAQRQQHFRKHCDRRHVYTNSQETHNMRIRQQDPVTKLWSMCEINSFLSAGGARCSIRIQ